MAATGGGKIRTRRYHIVSKPYAKGKQQVGLISRVTDTVKSIVPSWLQKYFRNEEVAEAPGGGVKGHDQPTPNGNEEVVPLQDGRDSPEPSTSNTESSTNKALLNFHDVLSRPPLNRSHLHFPSLDGSPVLSGSGTLFPQSSAASAPFSLVKEIKDSSSQHEDDNISTTSGFSSRASEKDVSTSRPPPQLWSPEGDRTSSGPQHAQSSLKKPTFNLSVFNTSNSMVLNSSGLISSQLGNSPFYPGKTTYGGAAAVVRSPRVHSGTPYQAPLRRQLKAKPSVAQPCGVTSATARRILQSLEHMSSPLADARKIPSTISSPLSTSLQSLDHSDAAVSLHQAKKKRIEPGLPPVQKLLVPTSVCASGNRSMSFRPSLTPRGANQSLDGKMSRPMSVRKSPPIPEPAQSPGTTSKPLSSTPASYGSGGGKMKRERAIRPSNKRPDDEVVEVPDLPAISLPISTHSLPMFTFSSTTPTNTVSPVVKTAPPSTKKSLPTKETQSSSPPPCAPFTFSSPIVKATAASPPTFSPSSGFTFSAPVMKTCVTMSNGSGLQDVTVKVASCNSEEESEGPFKPAKFLKQGSVLDLLKDPGFSSTSPEISTAPNPPAPLPTDKFKPAAGSWSCSTCLLQNTLTDTKCVTCQTPKPDDKPVSGQTAPLSGLAALFAPPAGSWECDTCLVQNKPGAVRCVACDTAKPGTAVKHGLMLPNFSDSPKTTTSPSSSTPTPGLSGFGDQFKKPEGSWECNTCLVQNKEQDSACVACQSTKPGVTAAPTSVSSSAMPLLGFGDQFRKPDGSWECDTCLVQNKYEDPACVACQTPKPGASIEKKNSGFGVSSCSSGGFKFGSTASSSDSAAGAIKFGGSFSDSSSTLSGGFKFGGTSDSVGSVTTGFKFGGSSVDLPNSGGFKFGSASTAVASSSESTNVSGGFKFGSSASSTTAPREESLTTDTPSQNGGLKFDVAGGFSFGTSTAEPSGDTNPQSTASETPKGFSFGQSKLECKPPSTTFSFSTTAPKVDKEEHPPETQSAASTPSLSMFGKAAGVEPTKAPTTMFLFGKPEEEASPPQTGLIFAPVKEQENPAASTVTTGFDFKQETQKDSAKASFTFSKPAEKCEPEPPKPTFSFGQSGTDTTTKPAFGFVAPVSTSSPPAPSLFGGPTTSTPAPASTSTYVFGQSSSSDAPPAKTFTFGQQQHDCTPGATQNFLFAPANNAAATSFSFGSASSSTAASSAPQSAAPAPFLFNAASSISGFGSSQTPVFGQGSAQSTTPAFGSAAPSFSASSSQPSAFGTKPSTAPVFGQAANAAPAFGSASASTGQGGFQFSGASAFGASGSSTGVFTFGGGPAAAASAGTQSCAPGGAFGFSQAPAFNIGSAKNSFIAAPAGQNTISGRKIKTAFRRRKQ
ncbi:nuclear pore complex protein Nup153 isoform X2 [Denticeps clupeoides]|uniref:nuclear pore complex protein Nup153 isoform X2 n=1 Tax=Denticeps clupeoides TaxID=299321 RepID=UPI0010A57D96|nr:nuclear pore complex protein Nup153 isoform X2 [Denticeps clupeoides]